MANKSTEEMRLYMQERRSRIKAEMLNMLGGECVICGSTDSLDFDHVDPSTKVFQISGRGLDKPRGTLLVEVKKCQLLCKPHHIEKTRAWYAAQPTQSRKGKPEYAEHGTVSGYGYYGCRCEACRLAKHLTR